MTCITDFKKTNNYKKKVWWLVLSFTLLVIGLSSILALHVFQIFQSQKTYYQTREIGTALDIYNEKYYTLPGAPRSIGANCEQNISWREQLAPFVEGSDYFPMEATVFALLYSGSPWTDPDSPSIRTLKQIYGNPVIVVHFGHHIAHTKWTSNCDLILKEDKITLQGQVDTPIDLSGAYLLRLNGEVEKLPENLTFQQIVNILRDKKN